MYSKIGKHSNKKLSPTFYRIIDIALKLFNEKGERNVNLGTISEHMNISSGNMYYHFKNKGEIILCLYRKFQTELLQCFDPNRYRLPLTCEDFYLLLKDIAKIMWEYRCLLLDSFSLVSKNPTLYQEYTYFLSKKILPISITFLDASQKSGALTAMPDNGELLAQELWIHAKYWFDFEYSIGKPLDISSCFRCARHLALIIRPYVTEAYLPQHDWIIASLQADITRVHLRLQKGIEG